MEYKAQTESSSIVLRPGT